MVHRPILPILILSMVLAACSFFGNDDAVPKTKPLRTALPPAEIPTYGVGDSYTYDNPKETWTVVSIKNDLIRWKSSLGNSQLTAFDPLLPPIEWTVADNPQATRKFLEWNGSMFPLQAGSNMTYKEVVRLGENTGPTQFEWRCYTGRPQQVHVPAGRFATVPVLCQRSDGYKAQGYYAPAINTTVSITYGGSNTRPDVRSLQSFALGKGERIAAKDHSSLPRGWSEALIDRSSLVVALADRQQAVSKKPAPAAARRKPSSAMASAKSKRRPKTRRSSSTAAGASAEPGTAAGTRRARSLSKPETGAGGRYLVQLSSLNSPIVARKEWTRLQKAFHEQLGDKKLRLEKRAIAGRGTFYRVQTGQYQSLKKARSVCAALKEKNQGCLTIKR
ncbi:MAG: SPOR domain-containing protein [Alphaproteobacteria bacterium]|nr:SPOR domain-containing protein [Alphaproteobacteria bacterium]